MDERTINNQTLRTMTTEELHRLNNALYYTESTEGQWLVQAEIVRRKALNEEDQGQGQHQAWAR